jgi:isoquinoline 1-oxidoreductase beta subunit
VQQSNFHDYRLLRIAEVPPIAVHIIEGDEAPGSFGEIGVPAVAPALANAVFAATGKRIRTLPIPRDGIVIA